MFIDIDNDCAVIGDQWKYLQSLVRVSAKQLDALYKKLSDTEGKMPRKSKTNAAATEKKNSGTLHISLNSMISIPKSILPPKLISYLREELNILNIGYLVKERAGLPTYGEKRFINTIEQNGESILIPRGFLPDLTVWLKENSFTYKISDERLLSDPVRYSSSFTLFPYQETAVSAIAKDDQGILVAPAGSGKTIMGLSIIVKMRRPAIVLTHRRQIYDQWLEQAENGFGIPRRKIGQINGIKKKVELPITIAMVQTLARMGDISSIVSKFGMVIVDECHHVPARMFREVVSKFPAKYRFGLTATPSRKYNDEKLIEAYLGKTLHTISEKEAKVRKGVRDKNASDSDIVLVHTTELAVPFGSSLRDFPLISKSLSNDSARNTLITEDIKREAALGKKCLVLTERKEHAEMLRAYLRKDFETVLYSGDLSTHRRTLARQKIQSGSFKVLVATGQILGEGTDIANLETLFLAFPVSFHGKLAQYIGRVSREGGPKKVYDYRDSLVPILEKLWKKRATFYRKNKFNFSDLK